MVSLYTLEIGIYMYLKAVHGAIVGIEQQAGEGARLRRSIPAVRAVHKHRGFLDLDRVGDEQRRLHHRSYVLQPVRFVQAVHERARIARVRAFKQSIILRLYTLLLLFYQSNLNQLILLNLHSINFCWLFLITWIFSIPMK